MSQYCCVASWKALLHVRYTTHLKHCHATKKLLLQVEKKLLKKVDASSTCCNMLLQIATTKFCCVTMFEVCHCSNLLLVLPHLDSTNNYPYMAILTSPGSKANAYILFKPATSSSSEYITYSANFLFKPIQSLPPSISIPLGKTLSPTLHMCSSHSTNVLSRPCLRINLGKMPKTHQTVKQKCMLGGRKFCVIYIYIYIYI